MSTLLSPQDRLDLLDLGARYAHAYDGGCAQEYAALFIAGGLFQRDKMDPVVGTAALAGMVEAAHARAQGYLHITANAVLSVSEEGASGTSYVLLMRVDGETLHVLAAGTYDDTYVRTLQGWRFQARRFTSRSESTTQGPLHMAVPKGSTPRIYPAAGTKALP